MQAYYMPSVEYDTVVCLIMSILLIATVFLKLSLFLILVLPANVPPEILHTILQLWHGQYTNF